MTKLNVLFAGNFSNTTFNLHFTHDNYTSSSTPNPRGLGAKILQMSWQEQRVRTQECAHPSSRKLSGGRVDLDLDLDPDPTV